MAMQMEILIYTYVYPHVCADVCVLVHKNEMEWKIFLLPHRNLQLSIFIKGRTILY